MRLHNLLGEDGRIVKGVNTTVDVGPDEIKKQAKKFGNTVDKDGNPPTLSTKVKGKSTNVLFNLGITEGIVLKLERNKHMDVLHIMDTNEKHRVEVRGKKGYERGNYDAQDKLHQVLDRVGKAANISELINGETVSINPKHPQGPDAIRTAKDVLQTEAILKKKFNAMELALMEGGNSIDDYMPKIKNPIIFNLGLFEEKPTTNIRKNYNEFARFCVDTLAIQKFPKITMTGQALDRTFGYFDIDEQSITVSYNNRHQMDTMRTLAHELVHCKQREEREDLDGSDGSPDENEANAMAGVLLRRWADKNPNLFSESVEIIDESWAKKYITKERSQTEATEIASATKIYVDMDGVLADFFTEWGKLMGKDDWRDIGQEHIPAALEKIKQTENFWLDLPLTSNAKTLLKLIKDIKGSYTILSSPLPGDPNSEPHKLEWIKNNLSFFPPEEILIRHDKETFATQEDGTPNILIDDYGVNIQKWEAAGGVGFKHKDHKFERTADAIKQHMQEPVEENFADGKVSGNSRPGRVKRSGASCNGSVTDLRKRAKNASGERAKMLHWCANMKAGKQK